MSNTQSGALSYGEPYGGPPYGGTPYEAPEYGATYAPYAPYETHEAHAAHAAYGSGHTYEGGEAYAPHGAHDSYEVQDAYAAYEAVYGHPDPDPAPHHSAGLLTQDHPGGIPAPATEPDFSAPGLSAPGLPEPDFSAPDLPVPGFSAPEFTSGPTPEHASGPEAGPALVGVGRADGRRAARRRKGASTGPGSAGGGSDRPDTLRKLVPQALVVAFLAGGTSAFVANDKSIQLSVDGAPRTLHTFADDVTELLEREGVAVGEHDLVAPGPGQTLASGDEVVVRYGRPVTLNIDGERRRVWTTARTVDGALRQLGVRAEGAYLSASRSSPISRKGLSLDVRTERTLTVMADGRERTIRTNAATVQEAIEEAGISLANQDTTSVPLDSFPRDGQTVTVMRITGSRVVREEPIDFEVVRKNDPTLLKGTEEIVQSGAKGARRVTYALRTVNGVKQRPRKLSEEIARQPVDRVVKVGTKPKPRTPSSVAGADGLNWGALAQCESGGRPGATDPSGTYGGLYQFDRQTWQSLGGSGAAHEAPAAEQTYRAKKLYVQRGASPWPHCGKRL
ncbi:ubiquitin-like domain-containing protein [Streptomyces sp. NPDC058657]|uniref:ubiquitin-like domain-containing protein n=1 Tax=unclassified Streptomyces TaxID=2593676 RepID=UPI00364CFC81